MHHPISDCCHTSSMMSYHCRWALRWLSCKAAPVTELQRLPRSNTWSVARTRTGRFKEQRAQQHVE